jgi:hypothetical protein
MKTAAVALACAAVILTAFGLQCPCAHGEPELAPVENACGQCAPEPQPGENPDECCCVHAHQWAAVSFHPDAAVDAAPVADEPEPPDAPRPAALVPPADAPTGFAVGPPLYLLAGILLR